MDFIFYVAIFTPIIIAGLVMWLLHESITPLEALAQAVIPAIIVSLVWWGGRYSDTHDYELWNGEVTRKITEQQRCPIGWQDYTDGFCTEYTTRRVKDGPPRKVCSGEGKDKRCHAVQDYKTQYNYIYPWERKYWLDSNVKETFYIPRVDAQGRYEPPRYTSAYVGEPVAAQKSYTNWIRGASNSVFHEDGKAEEKYLNILPKYPIEVYDYYRVDRVIAVGNVSVPNYVNGLLSNLLKDLGPNKQMNVILVLVDTKVASEDFPYAVRRFWQGFKKNDAVVFMGVNDGKLAWAESMSWSKQSIYDITIRDSLSEGIGQPINFPNVINKISETAKAHYERREMKEFEFLKSQIPVPTWLTVMALVLSVGGSIGLVFVFHHIDLGTAFQSNRRSFR